MGLLWAIRQALVVAAVYIATSSAGTGGTLFWALAGSAAGLYLVSYLLLGQRLGDLEEDKGLGPSQPENLVYLLSYLSLVRRSPLRLDQPPRAPPLSLATSLTRRFPWPLVAPHPGQLGAGQSVQNGDGAQGHLRTGAPGVWYAVPAAEPAEYAKHACQLTLVPHPLCVPQWLRAPLSPVS